MLKRIISSIAVSVAAVGVAAAMALPASASTGIVGPGVPITGIHHPGLRPGLGLRPGIGLGLGLGGCSTCATTLPSYPIGIGDGGCSTCGLGGGLGFGSPIYVSQVPWYGISSASLCDSGCGGLGISTLPSTVFLNGLNGDCAFSAGGALIPGFGGFGFRHHLHGLGLSGIVSFAAQ